MNSARKPIRAITIGAFAVATWTAAPVSAQTAGAKGAAAPMRVQMIRGQYCMGFAPPGYRVAAENPQRVAFGADVHRQDGRGGASYAVFGGGPITGVPAWETPEGAIASWLSGNGSTPTRFGRPAPVEPGVSAVEFQTPSARGVAIYRVLPQQGGFVVVMRTAMAQPDLWALSAPELVAVARSLRCNVPMVPAAADPPPRARERSGAKAGGEGDSEYNQWLGMEHYHDARTGQNYWVSPSRDWSETGPQGAGYYIRNGNDTIKLDSGYSR
jgi:hypothetical protein